MNFANGEVKQISEVPSEVLDSSSSSVHVRKDYKSPSGNIDPDLHHSVDAKSDYCFHEEAKSPPELTERRPRLKLPSTSEGWKKINEELEIALPRAFSDLKRKTWSCSELDERFHRYLYNFIAQRVPQEEEKMTLSPSKTRNVLRSEAALEKNRKQKLHHKKYIKSLKSTGCFVGDVAKIAARMWRKLLKIGNRLRRRLKHALEQLTQRCANARFRASPHDFAKNLFKPRSVGNDIRPSKERCEQYFPHLYTDPCRKNKFEPMGEMKRPVTPTVPLSLDLPNRSEFRRAVWSKRQSETLRVLVEMVSAMLCSKSFQLRSISCIRLCARPGVVTFRTLGLKLLSYSCSKTKILRTQRLQAYCSPELFRKNLFYDLG